jgi:CDP-diacylglycerol--glycerol-3-phosphate 3-phosphatidyltransferase
MISANLNRDYFTNRQDRYIKFKDATLTQFYADMILKVCEFSYCLGQNGDLKILNALATQRDTCGKELDNLYGWWTQRQSHSLSSGTIVVPAFQMKSYNIQNDQSCLEGLLSSFVNSSDRFKCPTKVFRIHLASGYFNLPNRIQRILWRSDAQVNILTSSPEANGFFNSKGVSRYIPPAYSFLERRFLQSAEKMKKSNIILHEYKRKNWTWHAKGLWIESDHKIITSVGSSNLNYRSIHRDLEAQFYIITDNQTLKDRIRKNLLTLYQYTAPITLNQLSERRIPILLQIVTKSIKKFL